MRNLVFAASIPPEVANYFVYFGLPLAVALGIWLLWLSRPSAKRRAPRPKDAKKRHTRTTRSNKSNTR